MDVAQKKQEILERIAESPATIVFARIDILNEIQLADAINTQALNHGVETVLLNGKRFDCGSIEGYVKAIKYVSSNYKFK